MKFELSASWMALGVAGIGFAAGAGLLLWRLDDRVVQAMAEDRAKQVYAAGQQAGQQAAGTELRRVAGGGAGFSVALGDGARADCMCRVQKPAVDAGPGDGGPAAAPAPAPAAQVRTKK